MKIQFADNEHRDFYERTIQQCRNTDSYHRALVYTLGLSPDTRSHFKDCFSIPGDCIDPDALSKGWQTSGSMALTRLAFNLWNGFDDNYCTPADLFNHAYAPYLFQAVQLRYPEHFRGKDAPIFDER